MDNFTEIPGLFYYINGADEASITKTDDVVSTIVSTVTNPDSEVPDFVRTLADFNGAGNVTHNASTIKITNLPAFNIPASVDTLFQDQVRLSDNPGPYAGPLTVVTVFQGTTTGAARVLYDSRDTNSASNYMSTSINTNDIYYCTANSSTVATSTTATDQPTVLVQTFDRQKTTTDAIKFYVDKGLVHSRTTDSSSRVHDLSRIEIFDDAAPGKGAGGKIGIMCWYQRAFTQQEVDDVTDLCNHWIEFGTAPTEPVPEETKGDYYANTNDPNATLAWQWTATDPGGETEPVWDDALASIAAAEYRLGNTGQTNGNLHIESATVAETGWVRCKADADYQQGSVYSNPVPLTIVGAS